MNELLKLLAGIGLAVIILAGILFGASGLGLIHAKLFGPAYEQTRYDTFQQSQAHIDGVVRQLRDYRARYAMAETPEVKNAIRTAVFSELGSLPIESLPPDLAIFVRELGR